MFYNRLVHFFPLNKLNLTLENIYMLSRQGQGREGSPPARQDPSTRSSPQAPGPSAATWPPAAAHAQDRRPAALRCLQPRPTSKQPPSRQSQTCCRRCRKTRNSSRQQQLETRRPTGKRCYSAPPRPSRHPPPGRAVRNLTPTRGSPTHRRTSQSHPGEYYIGHSPY